MDKIRIVKDENGEVFLSQKDLLTIMNERLKRFPGELTELRKPKPGKIVGADGEVTMQPPDEKMISKHEGMEVMLRGIVNIIDVKPEA